MAATLSGSMSDIERGGMVMRNTGRVGGPGRVCGSGGPGGSGGLLTPRSVTWAAIVIDASLFVTKLAAAIAFGSQAIMADSLHGASDMVTDFAVLAGLALANRPADMDHPYGHRRISTLVTMFVGAVLMLAAGWIAYRAIVSLHGPARHVEATIPFWLALVTLPIKELLYRLTHRVGLQRQDMSLVANAWHHRTDAFSSAAAAAGLAGVMLAGPGWMMLDALVALVLAAFLLVVGGQIMLSSASELADAAPSAETLGRIRTAVKATSGVENFHAFRARHTGGKVEMDVHVQVAPSLTVGQGHEIAAAVKYAVMRADPSVVSVVVHIEPTVVPGAAGEHNAGKHDAGEHDAGKHDAGEQA